MIEKILDDELFASIDEFRILQQHRGFSRAIHQISDKTAIQF